VRSRHGTWWWSAAACLFLAATLPGLPAAAQVVAQAQAPTGARGSVQGRFANVERLIETSSGAKQVRDSGSPKAVEAWEAARGLFAQAKTAHGAGNEQQAGELLDRATRTMFDAVRLAGAPASLGEKKRRDFAAREESVDVLLEALARIGKEKGSTAITGEAAASVGKLLAEARALRDAGSLDRGRATLDAAYEQAKRAVEAQRGGETLVRSLNFANKEEEYRYELDRNDTHRMLVDVLTTEKRAKPGVDRLVGTYTARARKLREDAEGQAAGGDHARAVTTLELSTKEYIRAIRSTGIYIPG